MSGLVLAAFYISAGCSATPRSARIDFPNELPQLRADLATLTAPAFEGRGIGTDGLERAADYLARRFADIGLIPIEDDTFRQRFKAASTRPTTTQPILIANIVGMCRGQRADEYVIVGAHYDHLGFGGHGSAAPWSHALHPGGDDNASGTAAILALARRVVAGPKPQRSIVFVCFAGEERGLLGSDFFVNHPPIDLTHVVAMINLDMIGRLRSDRVYVGGEGTADPFMQIVRQADLEPMLELKTFTLGGGGPSDHLTFSQRHIPVLFFFTGLHADYHTPRDVAEALNVDGEERIISLVARCVEKLSAIPRPSYRDVHDHDASILTSVLMRTPPALGITLQAKPDRGAAEVVAIALESPCAGAIAIGDRLCAVDGLPIRLAADLDDALRFSMPGDEIRITIEHAGRTRVQRVFLLPQSKD